MRLGSVFFFGLILFRALVKQHTWNIYFEWMTPFMQIKSKCAVTNPGNELQGDLETEKTQAHDFWTNSN